MTPERDGRLILVGLDGATMDVLGPYMQRGIMPNLNRMVEQGSAGSLEAAMPPVTGPSWVSFMTGMNPGRHGIFDFVKRVPGSVTRQPVTFDDIRTRTLWEVMSDAGRSVGVVNLPITYPAPKISGFVIPGMLAPTSEGEFAHPTGLMAEVRQAVGEYVLDVWWQHYGENADRFLDDLLHCTRQRIAAFHYLLDNKSWDLFMGVFIGTDRIQHYLWNLIHPPQPESLNPQEGLVSGKIDDYFSLVDSFLGDLLDRYGRNTDILIMSDHGFGPLRGKMYVNRWLEENGYLRVDSDRLRKLALRQKVMGVLKPAVRKLDVMGLRRWFGARLRRGGRMSAYAFLECIDWERTAAYSASNTEQGIYLNVRGREPQGILDAEEEYHRVREDILSRLGELIDPDTGEPVPARVFKREDLYQGPCVEFAPDIVFFLKDGEWLLDVQLKDRMYEPAGMHTGSGTHRLEGILVGHGPRIRQGVRLTGARIVDVAPSVLYQQGLPVPEAMDGRPLLQMFDEDLLKDRPPAWDKDPGSLESRSGTGHVLTNQEQEEVERRLKGLGYL